MSVTLWPLTYDLKLGNLTSWVAIASFASILIIGESVELGSAPVAISSFDVSLAGAFARYFVTTAVVNSAECVAPE